MKSARKTKTVSKKPVSRNIATANIHANVCHQLAQLAKQNPSMEVLDLSNQGISDMNEIVNELQKFTNLQQLILSGNPLKTLPVFGNDSIVHVDVGQIIFKDFEQALINLSQLPNLTALSIELQQEREVDMVMQYLPNLETLNNLPVEREEDQNGFNTDDQEDLRRAPMGITDEEDTDEIQRDNEENQMDIKEYPELEDEQPSQNYYASPTRPAKNTALTRVTQRVQRPNNALDAFKSNSNSQTENPCLGFVQEHTQILHEHGVSASDVKRIASCYDALRQARKRAMQGNNDKQVFEYFQTQFNKVLGEAKLSKNHDVSTMLDIKTKQALLDTIHESRQEYLSHTDQDLRQIDDFAHEMQKKVLEDALNLYHQSKQENVLIKPHEELQRQNISLENKLATAKSNGRIKDTKIAKLQQKLTKLQQDFGLPVTTSKNTTQRFSEPAYATTGSPTKTKRNTSLGKKKSSTLKKKKQSVTTGPLGVLTPRTLTLKQLREVLQDIYSSKARFDKSCKEQQIARETMEQYLYTYLNLKYGLRPLIIEWIQAILNGLNEFKNEDHECKLFGKILKNECDEEFRMIQVHIKDTVNLYLKQIIEERFPQKNRIDTQGMMDQITSGMIDQWMIKKILDRMYDAKDQEKINILIRQQMIYRARIQSQQKNNSQRGSQYESALMQMILNKKYESTLKNASVLANVEMLNQSSAFQDMTEQEQNQVIEEMSKEQVLFKDFQKCILDFQLKEHEEFLREFVLLFREYDELGYGLITQEQFRGLVGRMNMMAIEQSISLPANQGENDTQVNARRNSLKLLESDFEIDTLANQCDPFNTNMICFSEIVVKFSQYMVEGILVNAQVSVPQVALLEKFSSVCNLETTMENQIQDFSPEAVRSNSKNSRKEKADVTNKLAIDMLNKNPAPAPTKIKSQPRRENNQVLSKPKQKEPVSPQKQFQPPPKKVQPKPIQQPIQQQQQQQEYKLPQKPVAPKQQQSLEQKPEIQAITIDTLKVQIAEKLKEEVVVLYKRKIPRPPKMAVAPPPLPEGAPGYQQPQARPSNIPMAPISDLPPLPFKVPVAPPPPAQSFNMPAPPEQSNQLLQGALIAPPPAHAVNELIRSIFEKTKRSVFKLYKSKIPKPPTNLPLPPPLPQKQNALPPMPGDQAVPVAPPLSILPPLPSKDPVAPPPPQHALDMPGPPNVPKAIYNSNQVAAPPAKPVTKEYIEEVQRKLAAKIAKLYVSKIPKPPTNLPVPPPLPVKQGTPPVPNQQGVPPPAPALKEKMPEVPTNQPPKPPPPASAFGMPAPPPQKQQILKASDIPPPPAATLTPAQIAKKAVMAFLPDNLKLRVKAEPIIMGNRKAEKIEAAIKKQEQGKKQTPEQIIMGIIDQLWDKYDDDNSGALDYSETKNFIRDSLSNLPGDKLGEAVPEFNDHAFAEVFLTFDEDGSGTIEKNEMVAFLKHMIGAEDLQDATDGSTIFTNMRFAVKNLYVSKIPPPPINMKLPPPLPAKSSAGPPLPGTKTIPAPPPMKYVLPKLPGNNPVAPPPPSKAANMPAAPIVAPLNISGAQIAQPPAKPVTKEYIEEVMKQMQEKLKKFYVSKIPKPPTHLPIPPPLDLGFQGAPPLPGKTSGPPPPPNKDQKPMPTLPGQGPPKPPPPRMSVNMPAPPPQTAMVMKGNDLPQPPAKTLSAQDIANRMIQAFLPAGFKGKEISGDDPVVKGMIDQIWATYDVDNSGELDRQETKAFIKDTINKLPAGSGAFDENQFNDVFTKFDTDGNGTIERGEMLTFIKNMMKEIAGKK